MQIKINYTAPPAVNKLLSLVRDHTALNRAIAYDEALLVARHLRVASTTRHNTATRLGASPTGHLERAANSVTMGATSSSALVNIHSPGITRALHPITIRPVRARALTIPLHSIAYGKRASVVASLLGTDLFKYGKTLAANLDGDPTPTPLYALVQSVTIPQDRGLLPTQRQLTQTATLALQAHIRANLRQ